jgi:hypothetical protein
MVGWIVSGASAGARSGFPLVIVDAERWSGMEEMRMEEMILWK